MLLLLSQRGRTQTVVKGFVKDEKGKSISAANILIKENAAGSALAFAITDATGSFTISLPNVTLPALLSVSCIGYATEVQSLIAAKFNYTFILQPQPTLLPTVVVKKPPIALQGDPIKYDVHSFTGIKDEMIGDVIAHLPGVQVDANGQISYNGKAISHYYIDGIDMLGPKYNIANRNLPSNLVNQVEVLQRHQDIEMLRDIKASNEVALNLKLNKKAKNKFIGGGTAGAGLAPVLWDVAARGLNFRNNFQMITAAKTNNIGQNIATEISDNISVYRRGNEPIQPGLQQAIADLNWPTPPLSSKRYQFNNSALAHFNGIKLFKNKTQISSSVSYFNDYSSFNNIVQTKILLADTATINFTEQTAAHNNRSSLEGRHELLVNNKKRYLKNNIKFKTEVFGQQGFIKNTTATGEHLRTPLTSFSDEFTTLLRYKKVLINFTSANFYSNNPQLLRITPGPFAQALNAGQPYEGILQQAQLKSFTTDNTLSFSLKTGKLIHEIKAGLSYRDQQLESGLTKVIRDSRVALPDSFNNKFLRKEIKVLVEEFFTIKKGKSVLDATLPLIIQSTKVKEQITSLSLIKNYFFFNPRVSYLYKYTSQLEIALNLESKSEVSGLLQQIPGYIVSNYRLLQRGAGYPQLTRQQGLSVEVSYQDPIQGFFAGGNIGLGRRKNDLIYDEFYNGFLITSKALPIINFQNDVGVTGRVSKYFIAKKLNISANGNFTKFKNDLLQNSALVKNTGNTYSTNLKLEYNQLKKLGIASSGKYTKTLSRINGDKAYSPAFSYSSFTQTLQLTYTITPKFFLYNTQELYRLNYTRDKSITYYFADIGIARKFKKRKVELEWNNITNNKKFNAATSFQNINRIATYTIRPTNLLLRFTFKF